MDEKRTPVLILAICCAATSVFAFAATTDLAWYLQAARLSKLANPPKLGAVVASLIVLLALSVSLIASTWKAGSPSRSQRIVVSQWSVAFVLLWGALVWCLLLVNYPIPPQAHHTDKFLIVVAALLGWSLWFNIHPKSLATILNGRWYGWVKVVIVNILIFVLVGEAGMRLADPALARNALFGDRHSPANLKPYIKVRGSIGHANSQGFRDRERLFERTGAGPRLVALGDSFTYGSGVSYDETFVTLLERELQETASGAEIINLGVPAWGPHEEFHLLKAYGVRFNPDAVILNFFIGNDIQNKRGDDFNLPETLIIAGQSYYVHRNGNRVHDTIGMDRWYLYHNLNYLVKVGGSRIPGRLESDAGEWAPLVSRDQYLKGIYERSDIYLKENTRFFEQHWNRTKAVMVSIRDFLDARGIPLIVVLIPEHIQLDRSLQQEYLVRVGGLAEQHDFLKPQRLMRRLCEENQIQVVDLVTTLATDPNPGLLHFENDIHWSVAGHKLAAKGISSALQNWLPRHNGTRAHVLESQRDSTNRNVPHVQ